MGGGECRGSKREDSGSIGLQREFTRDEVKECVAKLKNRKAAGADGIVNEFLKYGGCLLYTSPSPRDLSTSRMPSSA